MRLAVVRRRHALDRARERERRAGRRSRGERGAGPLRMAVQLISIAYLSALGGLLWWAQAPILVGWQPKVVLTGSMLPVIHPGDVALIGPGEF